MASADSEVVIATFTQAVLYGLYLLTSFHSFRWLLYQDNGWKLRDKMSWLMLVPTFVLFSFATVDMATSIHATLLFIDGGMNGGIDAEIYMQKLDIVNTVIENLTYLITDAILVYRCWLVYGNSWRIICFPVFLWLSCLTSTILIVFYEFHDFPNTSTAPSARRSIYYADVAFYACQIANNVYTTSAIIYRILQVMSGIAGGSRRLHKTLRIIADSGVLYSASSMLLLTAYIGASTNVPFFVVSAPVFDAINYSASIISFNLIIIRVSKQRAEETDTLLGSEQSKEISPVGPGVNVNQIPLDHSGSREDVKGRQDFRNLEMRPMGLIKQLKP